MMVHARSRCTESATDPSCQKCLVDVRAASRSGKQPATRHHNSSSIEVGNFADCLRSVNAGFDGRSSPFWIGSILDRVNFGPRQRRQALPHLPPKSLYIRATTGQMTASAWWLRQHSKAHHLRPHRRELNLLLPLRRYCGAHRSKSDLLSLWNNYNLRASQCRVCMPATAIRHKALSLL